jgi:hypothetical protein
MPETHHHRLRPARPDFWVALERTKDFTEAERVGLDFAEDFRLLRDIGWSEHDVREAYVLTMPAQELGDLLKRLKEEAASALIETGSEAESNREDAETDWLLRVGFEACGKPGSGSASARKSLPSGLKWPLPLSGFCAREEVAENRHRFLGQ